MWELTPQAVEGDWATLGVSPWEKSRGEDAQFHPHPSPAPTWEAGPQAMASSPFTEAMAIGHPVPAWPQPAQTSHQKVLWV